MTDTNRSRRHAIGLWALFALFAFRVVAQPLSLVVHLDILPPFESWHSAALPYPLLLVAQLAILVVFGFTARRFAVGAVEPRRSLGAVALVFGGLYFAAMVARLLLGLTVLSDQRWFASPIPTMFHLGLAGFILLYGHFHYVHGANAVPGR